jgi:hypothetical protein
MKIYSDISLIDASASISTDQNAFVLVRGNDGVVRRAPLTVNGAAMNAGGNITTALSATLVGPSASGVNNLINSSSGTVTGSITNGIVWIVANDSSTPDPDGQAFIFVSQSTEFSPPRGKWYPLDTLNQTQADLRYVKLSSSSTQAITSSLIISGSSTTFSSSLFWSGASNLGGAANNVLVLGNDGKLYITGAYSVGGGSGPGTPGGADTTIQFNDGGIAFSGSNNFVFNKGTNTTRLTGSLIVSSSSQIIGTTNITGSLIVSNSLNTIGTGTITGSLIVSSSSNVIGTSRVTGSLIVSSSTNLIGTTNITGSLLVSGSTPLRVIGGTSTITGSLIVSSSTNLIGTTNITGSLIASSSTNLIGTTNVTGSLIISNSSNVIGTSRVTGSLIVSSSSQIIGTETITGSLIVSSSSNVIGTSRVTGSLIVSTSLSVVGTGSISGSLTISSSVPGQTVLQITGTGSATTAPIVQVAGQTGAFVQVYDFNSGSLFSVNNNTGTPILDVMSNGQTLIGSNAYQGMYDSTGYALMPAPGQVLTIPGYLTSSYNALWFEYFTSSGSYSRAGLFHTSWSGSLSSSIDTTSSFLGTIPANNISFTASISGAFMQLIASASTNGWLIKGSIRGI